MILPLLSSLISRFAFWPTIVLLLITLAGCHFASRSELDTTVPGRKQSKDIEILGIYGYPRLFWRNGFKLRELGVNSVFVHSQSIDSGLMARAASEGLKVFAEFPTLNGKNYVDKNPASWPIDQNGNRVEPASWFMGVCPTEPEFRRYRLEQLRALLSKFDLDGIWMDYFHWHAQFEEPQPILPETCFCDNCLEKFQSYSKIQLPHGDIPTKAQFVLQNHDDQWRDWRCEVLSQWAVDIRTIVKELSPDALLGLYHCPWDDQEFDGARRRHLGLDYDLLRSTVDVFSPMVYHGRMGRKPEWVKDNIDWLSHRLKIRDNTFPKVWPIVQASDEPSPISASEFENVLRYGLTSESTGVMMFTSNAVATDDKKIAAMKKVYLEMIPQSAR